MTVAAAAAALRRPPNRLPRPNDPCWCGSNDKYKKCHKEADAEFLRTERDRLEANRLQPGLISPMRPVPPNILRPPYAETGEPTRGNGRHVRTPEELVRMRAAGKLAAKVLRLAGEQVKPGVTTDAIDAFTHQLIIEHNAYPSPLNYRGFPKSICTSVNEVICHGIPDSRALKDGDIVNIDVTVYLDGFHGDTNATFLVGNVDEETKKLVTETKNAMMQGIAAVKPGRPISDIGRAIENYATPLGYGVVRSYCGHGISDIFHTSLQIPHYFDASAKMIMQPGMTFTVEPMICAGTYDGVLWDDGWTVATRDLRNSAQFEHTLVVTETGAEILTVES